MPSVCFHCGSKGLTAFWWISKEEGLDSVFTFRSYKVEWRPAAKVFLEEYLASVAEQEPKPFWGSWAKLAARWGEDASWNSCRLRGKSTAPVPGACRGESPAKPECECEAFERSVLERATGFPKSPFFSLHLLVRVCIYICVSVSVCICICEAMWMLMRVPEEVKRRC